MKEKAALLILFVSWFAGLTAAEEPVQFTDINLKTAVEEVLGQFDPTPSDMLALTNLNAPSRDIVKLTGLQYALNLQTLDLSYNRIRDISALAGLTSLQVLILNNNDGIHDMSAVSSMTHLWYLDIHDNMIGDISALAGLSDLEEIVLRSNGIRDITVLSALGRLRSIDFYRNNISDISTLAGMTSLEWLDLRVNELDQMACEVYIPQILANNPGLYFTHDPCVTRMLMIEAARGGRVTWPGEGAFKYAYGEHVILEAKADPYFVFERWSGSYSALQNPLYLTLDRDHEIRAHFVSTLKIITVDDAAAGDPGPGETALSNPHENGTPEQPFDSIQEAIEVASEGAIIEVRPGLYVENIDLLGKPIRLLGMDGNDPDTVAYPVIQGGGPGPLVRFVNAEDGRCELRGFVLTKGKGSLAGAVYCKGSHPHISNCLMVGNASTDPNGSAVYCTDSRAVLANCTIADNGGGLQGGGITLVRSDVVLVDSIVWGNVPGQVLLESGSSLKITYTDIGGGWPGEGNLDVEPLFARPGYWADPDDPNKASGWDGEIATWVGGDYHLRSQAGHWDSSTEGWTLDGVTSPCIDAGDPNTPLGQEPFPHGGRVNMGAYGRTGQASQSWLAGPW